MNDAQRMVKEFHQKFMEPEHSPSSFSLEHFRAKLRVGLIREELEEFTEACGLVEDDMTGGLGQLKKPDPVAMLDAIGDLLYVVYGAAVEMGVDVEPFFNEIHRSNMTKLWPDGTVHRRADGKVLKPPTYSPADLKRVFAGMLRAQQTFQGDPP